MAQRREPAHQRHDDALRAAVTLRRERLLARDGDMHGRISITTSAPAKRGRPSKTEPWFTARIRRIEDEATGDAFPELGVRHGLYVTMTDGSAVQIMVDHIRDPRNGN